MGQRNIAPPAPAHPVKHGMTPMTFVLVLSAIATSSPLLGRFDLEQAQVAMP
jgi:hypothetical protein